VREKLNRAKTFIKKYQKKIDIIIRKDNNMNKAVKNTRQSAKKRVKPRTLKVISVCFFCGKPVNATTKDKAYRHGFKRYKKSKGIQQIEGPKHLFSQEDDTPCPGSGQEVVYKRYKK